MRGHVSRKTLFAFMGPAVIGLAAVGIAPLIYAIWTSLHFYNLTKLKKVKYIGFENYLTVVTDAVFWQAMGRTFFLLGAALPLQIILGTIIALALHQPGLTLIKTLCRLSLVLPMATTYAVVGLLGQVMFNQKFGVVNQLLGGANINWIGDPENALQ